MDFKNSKILDKINNLIKLSDDFDSGYKIIYELEPNIKMDEKNIEIIYSMTKNYIEMRKEHGEIISMMNNLTNKINTTNTENTTINSVKKNKNVEIKTDSNNQTSLDEQLYDLSTFATLLNNINDLINNIDYEYKKIALKYPKFINKNRVSIILISTEADEKYIKLIEKLKQEYPEYKYIILKCDNKTDINKCENELEQYKIKIKSIKSLPIIYVISNETLTEIPISKINKIDGLDVLEPIKNLIQ